MRGAAWSVPVVAAATAAPAFAASCPEGWVEAVGRGKALSGALFNLDLDALASVNGVIASAPSEVIESPGHLHGPQAEGDPDLHYDPLDVTALSAIEVNASGLSNVPLSSILSGLTPANLGAVNQYADAASDGFANGASGYVTDGGTIRTNAGGEAYPETATLDLKALLTPLLTGTGATFLANNVADLGLEIGALAGRAETEWTCVTETVQTLERDYLLSHLRLVVESALVSGLAGIIESAVLGVSVLGIAGLQVDMSVLTNGPLPTGAGQPIQLDLSAGTVTVDLGTLWGGDEFGADYSAWLNGRQPNTVLFVDTPLPSAALTDFTGGLISGLQDRLLDAVSVTILGQTGTLRALLGVPAVGTILGLLIAAINALFTAPGPVLSALDAVSDLLATIFGWLQSVINIRINAQNLPGNNVPATPYTRNGPSRWDSLEAGRYDVAALGVSAVEGVGLLDLYLGRGSVGPMTTA